MLPSRSAARMISSVARCQEPRSWMCSGSLRMKARTSASVASVVPSFNSIVRVSFADQPFDPVLIPVAKSVGECWPSLDHLVGAGKQRGRHFEAERLGGLHVNDELDFGRLLDRQLGGLLAFENSACIEAERTVRIQNGASVSHKAASGYKLAKLVDRGHPVANRQPGELFAATVEQ